MSSTLLKVENLGIQFGGLKAVQNVEMYIESRGVDWFNRSKWCR